MILKALTLISFIKQRLVKKQIKLTDYLEPICNLSASSLRSNVSLVDKTL